MATEFSSKPTNRGPLLQIPLKSFEIPPAANRAAAENGLAQIALFCDIEPDEYKSLLDSPSTGTIPALAPTIHTLCLLSFVWGYPPGFLTALGQQLHDVHNITLSRQLLTGPSEETRKDAENLLYGVNDLVDLHLFDVHVAPGFLTGLAERLKAPGKEGLMTLIVEYTHQADRDDFLEKLPVPELHRLITPGIGLISLTMSPRPPQGITPYYRNATEPFVQALTSPATAPQALRTLKCTLYQLSIEELKTVLSQHQGLFCLHVTLRLMPGEGQLEALWQTLEGYKALEEVEIAWFPSVGVYSEVYKYSQGGVGLKRPPPQIPADLILNCYQVRENRDRVLRRILPTGEQLDVLSRSCPNLFKFEVNVLRTPSLGYASWSKNDQKWVGGVTLPGEGVDA